MPPKKSPKRKSPPPPSSSASFSDASDALSLLSSYKAKLLSLAQAHAALLSAHGSSSNRAPLDDDLTSFSQLSDASPPPSPSKKAARRAPPEPPEPLFEEGATFTDGMKQWLTTHDTGRLSLSSAATTAAEAAGAQPPLLPDKPAAPNVRVGVGCLMKPKGRNVLVAGIRKGEAGLT